MRLTLTPSGLISRARYIAVASPSTLGLVATMTSRTGVRRAVAGAEAPDQLGDAEVVGADPVERRQQAVEHVVAAPEVAAALERGQVRRGRDHADGLGVAARVATQAARDRRR